MIVTLQEEVDSNDDVTEMEHDISADSADPEKPSIISEPGISSVALSVTEEVQVQPVVEVETKTEKQPEIEIDHKFEPEVEDQPDIVITPRVEQPKAEPQVEIEESKPVVESQPDIIISPRVEEPKVVKPKVEVEPKVEPQIETKPVEMRRKVAPASNASASSKSRPAPGKFVMVSVVMCGCWSLVVDYMYILTITYFCDR